MTNVLGRSTFMKLSGIQTWIGRKTNYLCMSKQGRLAPLQVATLKATYGESYPYEKPWPYETKEFNLFHELLYDSSIARINENSKVITVEGNIGVGKTDFARRLAKNFDLKFIPATQDDQAFILPNGFDMRCVDDILSPGGQSYDLKKFYADPKPEIGVVGRLQLMMYHTRFFDYAKALEHVLSTGQGVVMVRSVFSDMVFAEALRSMGYVSKNFMKYYYATRDNSICEFLKPHLTLYLDAPISAIRDRIKKRNDPREVNSKVLSDDYLKAIDTVHKNKFLPMMRSTGEVLEIDWEEVGDDMDMEAIAEELQELDLESEGPEEIKFQTWADLDDDRYAHYRKVFADKQQMQCLFAQGLPWDCPELLYTDEEAEERLNILWNHPGIKYETGWAPPLGDKTTMKLF